MIILYHRKDTVGRVLYLLIKCFCVVFSRNVFYIMHIKICHVFLRNSRSNNKRSLIKTIFFWLVNITRVVIVLIPKPCSIYTVRPHASSNHVKIVFIRSLVVKPSSYIYITHNINLHFYFQ